MVFAIAFVLTGVRVSEPWRRRAVAAGGNAARGTKLYETLPCASCHDISRPWPGGAICPNRGNIATEAARIVRRPDYHARAKDAARYIVPGPAYRQADG